jgi:hypothetical protein
LDWIWFLNQSWRFLNLKIFARIKTKGFLQKKKLHNTNPNYYIFNSQNKYKAICQQMYLKTHPWIISFLTITMSWLHFINYILRVMRFWKCAQGGRRWHIDVHDENYYEPKLLLDEDWDGDLLFSCISIIKIDGTSNLIQMHKNLHIE